MDKLHRIRSLLGNRAIEKLQKSTVMVFGCGAVGSFAIEALSRSGIGHLILVDFDKIETTNINRQIFALNSTIDMHKTDVAKQRVFDINPEINVDTLNIFFDKNTQIDFRPDFVIDAIDSVQSKIAIYNFCHEHNIPFISSMGAAQKTDISQIKVSKISKTSVCPLASKIRHLIKDLDLPDFPVVFSTQSPIRLNSDTKTLGSMITVTGVFGLEMANYAIFELIK
ncbi:MAG: ThiF family adenylyltransferase [Alphaproteobacteria bacterium]